MSATEPSFQQVLNQFQQLIQELQETIQQQQQISQQQQETIQQQQQTIQQQQADTNELQARLQNLQQRFEEQQQVQEQLRRQVQQLQQSQKQSQQQSQQQLQQNLQEVVETGEEEVKKARDIGTVVRHLRLFQQITSRCGLAAVRGRLFLSDFNHHVVDELDIANGNRVGRWGHADQDSEPVVGQPPRFKHPCGIAVNAEQGRMYVVDSSCHCVVVVQLNDSIVEAVWGSLGTGRQQFQNPSGLAYCSIADLLYVVDSENHCVKVVRGSDGKFLQVLGKGQGMKSPQDVAVDTRQIYIADTNNHRVLVYSKLNGRFFFQLGQGQGSGNTQFDRPVSVSVDSEADVVYVADYENYRVCVYRGSDGSYIRNFQVLEDTNFPAKPCGVAWDASSGVLYVTLEGWTTICVYYDR